MKRALVIKPIKSFMAIGNEDEYNVNFHDDNKDIILIPAEFPPTNNFDKYNSNIIENIMMKSTKSNFSFKKGYNKDDLINSLNDDDKHNVITNMIDKIEELDNQFRSVKFELDKTKSIEKAKKKWLITPLDLTESKLHFAFLFASPLVISSKSDTNFPQLDFNSELRNIENTLGDLEYEVIFKSVVATKGND